MKCEPSQGQSNQWSTRPAILPLDPPSRTFLSGTLFSFAWLAQARSVIRTHSYPPGPRFRFAIFGLADSRRNRWQKEESEFSADDVRGRTSEPKKKDGTMQSPWYFFFHRWWRMYSPWWQNDWEPFGVWRMGKGVM